MKIFPEPIVFEWDQGNSEKNVRKHGVANREAEEAVTNKPTFLFVGERHSQNETRYGLYGKTDQGRRLSIVCTIRKGAVRIITVRDMSKKEKSSYEKIEANSKI